MVDDMDPSWPQEWKDEYTWRYIRGEPWIVQLFESRLFTDSEVILAKVDLVKEAISTMLGRATEQDRAYISGTAVVLHTVDPLIQYMYGSIAIKANFMPRMRGPSHDQQLRYDVYKGYLTCSSHKFMSPRDSTSVENVGR